MRTLRSRIMLILGGLVVLIVITVAGWLFVKPSPLYIQGQIEATTVDVAAKIAARVDSLLLHEGDAVEKGQRIVTLNSPELRAKIQQALAAGDAARAQRNKAYGGAREEKIRASHNNWQRAKAAVELAEKTYARMDRLHADNIVPMQKRDEAEAQLKSARDAASAAEAFYDMAAAGTRSEDKQAAAALLRQAQGAIAEARAFEQELRLYSPISGEIVHRVVEPGELVAPGYPILTIIDLSDVWVTFNLREDRLSRIRMGSHLIGRVPALGDSEKEFEVSYISALGDYAAWRATNERGGFDLKTFEVRARPLEPIEGLRPGMSVIVRWDP